MKKLSDYKGDEAFELWADLMEPIVRIIQDKAVIETLKDKKGKFRLASVILRNCRDDAKAILSRIDDEPVNGLTLITRVIQVLAEIGSDPTIIDFFGYAEPETTPEGYSGSATVNTEAVEK